MTLIDYEYLYLDWSECSVIKFQKCIRNSNSIHSQCSNHLFENWWFSIFHRYDIFDIFFYKLLYQFESITCEICAYLSIYLYLSIDLYHRTVTYRYTLFVVTLKTALWFSTFESHISKPSSLFLLYPHRRASVQMRDVRQVVQPEERVADSPEETHGREAACVRILRPELHAKR